MIQQNTPRDLCKGPRKLYEGLLKLIVSSPMLAGILMGAPNYFLITTVIAGATFTAYTPFYSSASGFIISLLVFNIVLWLFELWAIRKTLPNLLGFCAFVHSAIGSWWLVNFVLFLFAGWRYIPIDLMFKLLSLLLTPSIVWHITGDIIRALKKKQIDEIHATSQIDEAFVSKV